LIFAHRACDIGEKLEWSDHECTAWRSRQRRGWLSGRRMLDSKWNQDWSATKTERNLSPRVLSIECLNFVKGWKMAPKRLNQTTLQLHQRFSHMLR